MRVSVRSIDKFISHLLVLLVICSFYVINDQKIILYSIRISFIFYMSFRFLLFNRKLTKYSLWAITFLTISLASVLWATNQGQAIYYFIWTLQVLIVAILLESFIDHKSRLIFVMKCFIFGGILLVIRLLIETPIETWGTTRIGTAIGYNANDVGLKLSFAALCSIYFINKSNKKYLSIALFSFSILSTVAMFSGSRKVFLILICGILIYSFFRLKKNIYTLFKYLPIAIIFLIIFYNVIMNVEPIYNVFGNRIEATIVTLLGDNSAVSESETQVREAMVLRGIELFANQPLLGYGLGNYAIVSGYGIYSHNNYIELLTSLGIIGFLLYYSIFIYLFLKLFKRLIYKNKSFAFPFATIFILLLIDMALVSFQTGYIQILIMLSYSFLRFTEEENNVHDRILRIDNVLKRG
ncbi:O-antigen ligase family protein [Bacillus sp. Marseille-P3661]|uniref:O-antigen ligase family protein n=1 Tax=Bacillus sp. Marseille-P3661 TaxID=1936234 RepID=UPI000C8587ED|nr:O-antigen ligase family protein [Bacillus sp. Marseille-P3661]